MTPIPLSFDNALFDDWEFERLLSQPYQSNNIVVKEKEKESNHNPFFDSLRDPTLQIFKFTINL